METTSVVDAGNSGGFRLPKCGCGSRKTPKVQDITNFLRERLSGKGLGDQFNAFVQPTGVEDCVLRVA